VNGKALFAKPVWEHVRRVAE